MGFIILSAVISFILFIAMYVVKLNLSSKENSPAKVSMIFPALSGILLFVALVGIKAFTQIPAGAVGVQTVFGEIQEKSLDEGAHFVRPWSVVTPLSLQTFKATLPQQTAGTKDLQTIHTDLVVNWRIEKSAAISIYRSYRDAIGETILLPIMAESLRAVTARHDSEQLLTKRDLVSQELFVELQTKLSKFNIVISNVALTNFGFSKEYQTAIESKVIATQTKLKSEQDLQRIEVEARSRIAQAQGEAEAIKIQSQAIQSNGGENYVKLQAIEKWNGVLPQTVAGGSVPFLNLK